MIGGRRRGATENRVREHGGVAAVRHRAGVNRRDAQFGGELGGEEIVEALGSRELLLRMSHAIVVLVPQSESLLLVVAALLFFSFVFDFFARLPAFELVFRRHFHTQRAVERSVEAQHLGFELLHALLLLLGLRGLYRLLPLNVDERADDGSELDFLHAKVLHLHFVRVELRRRRVEFVLQVALRVGVGDIDASLRVRDGLPGRRLHERVDRRAERQQKRNTDSRRVGGGFEGEGGKGRRRRRGNGGERQILVDARTLGLPWVLRYSRVNTTTSERTTNHPRSARKVGTELGTGVETSGEEALRVRSSGRRVAGGELANAAIVEGEMADETPTTTTRRK